MTNKLVYPEMVNEWLCRELEAGMFRGCIPICVEQKGNKVTLWGGTSGVITLQEYLRGPVTRRSFLELAYCLIRVVKNCEERSAGSSANLELQADRIWIDPRTKELWCILWPVVNNQRGAPPKKFLEELPGHLRFDPDEDMSCLKRYHEFFHTYGKPFSVNGFERMILELQGRHVSDEGAYSLPSGQLTPLKSASPTLPEPPIEYDPFSGQVEERAVYLVSAGTGERTAVHGPVFRIGAGQENDMRITGNRFISKCHAELRARDGRFYVVDNHSTNRTFINDRAIEPEVEAELCSGERLKLANEEFLFLIE